MSKITLPQTTAETWYTGMEVLVTEFLQVLHGLRLMDALNQGDC